MAQRRLDDDRMRATDRRDADGMPLLVARDEIEQGFHDPVSVAAGRSGSSTSSTDATSAIASPRIFSEPGTTPAKASASTAVTSGAPALVSGATTIALPWRNAYTSVNAPMALRIWMPAVIHGPSQFMFTGVLKSVMAQATGASTSPPIIM